MLVNTVTQIGVSVRVLLDKASGGPSANVVSVEGVAAHPTNAPGRRSLPDSPAPGKRQTVSPREVSGVCPRVVAPSTNPVAISQTLMLKHWKGVQVDHTLSSSGSDSNEPKGRSWHDSPMPLKRHLIRESGSLVSAIGTKSLL